MTEISEPQARPFGRGRVRKWLALFVAVMLVIYYPLGGWWVHVIDDDPDFTIAAESLGGGSRAVAIAAALIEREIDVHRWVANDPIFLPGSVLDNMPNFQQGVIAALARFAFELTDQIGRTRGSSQADRDLQEAAGLLQYSGTKWIFDLTTSFVPTATSEAQYRRARRALLDYNQRLTQGQAVFERRADNLQATLDRIALDLGSSSAALDAHISEQSGSMLDFGADDLFYNVKGQTYAYALVLRELEADFASVVREKELTAAWAQMLSSMAAAAGLSPWVIIDGAPDSQFLPSHLASLGFFVLRARTQLREITSILQK